MVVFDDNFCFFSLPLFVFVSENDDKYLKMLNIELSYTTEDKVKIERSLTEILQR